MGLVGFIGTFCAPPGPRRTCSTEMRSGCIGECGGDEVYLGNVLTEMNWKMIRCWQGVVVKYQDIGGLIGIGGDQILHCNDVF